MDLRWAIDEALDYPWAQGVRLVIVPLPSWTAFCKSIGFREDRAEEVSYRGVLCRPKPVAELNLVLEGEV